MELYKHHFLHCRGRVLHGRGYIGLCSDRRPHRGHYLSNNVYRRHNSRFRIEEGDRAPSTSDHLSVTFTSGDRRDVGHHLELIGRDRGIPRMHRLGSRTLSEHQVRDTDRHNQLAIRVHYLVQDPDHPDLKLGDSECRAGIQGILRFRHIDKILSIC